MNQEEKWTGDRGRDRGLTEIALLLTLLIFVAFGFVFYFFYQKVDGLSKQASELSSRLSELERSALGATENGSGLSRLREEIEALREQMVEAGQVASKTNVAGIQLDQENQQNSALTKVIGNIEVNLVKCADKMMFLYCDFQLNNLGLSGQTLRISNGLALAADNSGRIFNVSSFSFGTRMPEELVYVADVFVSKSHPIPLRFRFFDAPLGITEYSNVQFEIDGVAIAFESVAVTD